MKSMNKNKTKWLAFLLAVVLILSGCDSRKESGTQKENTPAANQQEVSVPQSTSPQESTKSSESKPEETPAAATQTATQPMDTTPTAPSEEPEEKEEEQPLYDVPYATIQMVNEAGWPVPGLCPENILDGFQTDNRGCVVVPIEEEGKTKLKFANPVSGAVKTYTETLSSGDEIQLVWDKESPAESAEKQEKKAKLKVMDKNGQVIPNAYFYFSNSLPILATDELGETWYFRSAKDTIYADIIYIDGTGTKARADVSFSVSEKQLQSNSTINIRISNEDMSITKLEEPEEQPKDNSGTTEAGSLMAFHIVDLNGKALSGFTVTGAIEPLYTLNNGKITMDLDQVVGNHVVIMNAVSGETMTYSGSLKAGSTVEFVWTKETPAQSAAGATKKVKFCVMDQDSDPVQGARFSFSDQRLVLPTDSNGESWYFGKAFSDNTYIDVTYTEKGEEKTDRFFVEVSNSDLINNNRVNFTVG